VDARIKYIYGAEKIEMFCQQSTTGKNLGLRKNGVKKIKRRDVEMKLLLPKLGYIFSW
jgi:hypothetical protein